MKEEEIFERVVRPAFRNAFGLEPHAHSASEGVWSVLVRRPGYPAPILLRVSLDEFGGNLTVNFITNERGNLYELVGIHLHPPSVLTRVLEQALVDILTTGPMQPEPRVG